MEARNILVMSEHNPNSAELQEIIRQGGKVFPVKSRGKEPLICGWPEQASNDPAVIAGWTAEFPGCNWGLASAEGGRFIVDIDGPGGEKWLEKQIETRGVEWTNTQQVATARGVHYHFKWPAGVVIRNSTAKIAAGVDIRGQGGYGLIPPSVHETGTAYVWRTDPSQRLAPAPAWLLELIRNSQPSDTPKRSGNGKRTIPAGRRNSTLASLAGVMRNKGLSETAIDAALQAENRLACDPPLDEGEVSGIAESIARYDPAPPQPTLILPRPLSQSSTLFETAAEFAAKAPTTTLWIAPPWIPATGMTELVAKIKCGKSTLALSMTYAVVNGGLFLDQRCTQSPVVYLTEQPETSLREALQTARLLDSSDLHLLRWHKALGTAWPDLARAAIEKAERVASKLIVVDTLGQFAQLGGDTENNSGAALEVLKPLQTAQDRGIAVVLIRHERKGESEISDAGRGSSAFAGAVDVLLRLRRLGSSHAPNYRKLETLSRFAETPAESILELTPDGYRLHDTAAVSLEASEARLLVALPALESQAMTALELAQATGQPRRTMDRVLGELVTAGSVVRLGAGIRGCAFRYYKTSGKEQIQ